MSEDKEEDKGGSRIIHTVLPLKSVEKISKRLGLKTESNLGKIQKIFDELPPEGGGGGFGDPFGGLEPAYAGVGMAGEVDGTRISKPEAAELYPTAMQMSGTDQLDAPR